MKKKKIWAVVLCLCLALGCMTGCGKAKQEESKTPTQEVKSSVAEETKSSTAEETPDYTGVVFRIAWWGNDTRAEKTTQMIDEFAKNYPGLKVEVEYCSYGDYYTKINTQVAGGEMPDVIQIEYDKVSTYAKNGQLLELSPFIEEGTIDLSNVSVDSLAGGMVGEETYAVSTGNNAACTIYNATLLEELGLTLSKTPTFSEFAEVAKAVYEKTGAKSFEPNYDIPFRSMGGDIYAKNGNAVGFDADMLTKYFTYVNDGMQEGYFLSNDDYREEEHGLSFENKIIWAKPQEWTNQLANMDSKTQYNLELAAIPVADDAVVPNATYFKPAMCWSVSKNSEHPELAAAFINFFVNEPIVYDICGYDRGLPISSEMRNYLGQSASETEKKVLDYFAFLEDGHVSEINTNVPLNSIEAFAEFNEVLERIEYKNVKNEEIPELSKQIVEGMKAFYSEVK